MNKTIKRLSLFAGLSLCFSSFASIDEKENCIKPAQPTSSFIHSSKVQALPTTSFAVDPVYLNRNLSVMTSFSSLPQNFLMTLEQSFLNYEVNRSTSIDSKNIKIKNAATQKEASKIRIRKQFHGHSMLLETYLSSSNFSDSDSLVSIGVRGQTLFSNLELNGEISYEDLLASSVASTSFKAALSGAYQLRIPAPAELKLALQYAGNLADSDLIRYQASNNSETIFDPDLSNISIVNLSLACAPSRNMFMSVDYYYYLQDQLEAQSFSNSLTSNPELYTTGESKNLGQEVNFKAIFTCSKNWKSEFFTGWFNPGEAYSSADDTKTFEIRGEIIVNF